MTLKKSKRGQAIFEYFILTTVVVAVVLFFSSSQYFKDIKTSCENVFNQAVDKMLNGQEPETPPEDGGGGGGGGGGSAGGESDYLPEDLSKRYME